MSTVKLIKWGNSIGIRIPSQDLKIAHAQIGQTFEIIPNKKGGFLINPIQDPQEGWLEAFNEIAEKESNSSPEYIENEFDKDDWTW